jgi:hypothetical protein
MYLYYNVLLSYRYEIHLILKTAKINCSKMHGLHGFCQQELSVEC